MKDLEPNPHRNDNAGDPATWCLAPIQAQLNGLNYARWTARPRLDLQTPFNPVVFEVELDIYQYHSWFVPPFYGCLFFSVHSAASWSSAIGGAYHWGFLGQDTINALAFGVPAFCALKVYLPAANGRYEITHPVTPNWTSVVDVYWIPPAWTLRTWPVYWPSRKGDSPYQD
jgi:hypothetical protein